MRSKNQKNYTIIILLCWSTIARASEITITVSNTVGNHVSLLPYGDFMNEKQIIFRVKGTWDANIEMVLFPTSYWVIIGGWHDTVSAIMKADEPDLQSIPVQHAENGIFNANSFTEFWISWKNGKMRVGKGNIVDQNIFMEREEECIYAVQDIKLFTSWNTITWILQSPNEVDQPKTPIFQEVINCPSFLLAEKTNTESKIKCSLACLAESKCKCFKFEQNDKKCELRSVDPAMTLPTISNLYVMRD